MSSSVLPSIERGKGISILQGSNNTIVLAGKSIIQYKAKISINQPTTNNLPTILSLHVWLPVEMPSRSPLLPPTVRS